MGSLFTGIGGFDLGFERAGFDMRWMCEIDAFCRKVLKRHWPEVPIYEDIKTLVEPEPVDCLIGGFPCQDISAAGKRAGLNAERSGLWWEYFRVICKLRPRYVAIENVSEILARGNLDTVLGALASIGYDAEWDTLSACSFGAPHVRKRVFIISYPSSNRLERVIRQSSTIENGTPKTFSPTYAEQMANGNKYWCQQLSESFLRTVADGPPNHVARNHAIGNAVVPEVAEYVARCIQRHAQATQEAHD